MSVLKEQLSILNYNKACKLLGPEGNRLLLSGGKYDIDIDTHVEFTTESFKVNINGSQVSIFMHPMGSGQLIVSCSQCNTLPCVHKGAALSLILEEKQTLGLAELPPEKIPVESLSDEELIEQAIKDREERAKKEKMDIKSMNGSELWTDYVITNQNSGKSYRVALRGWEKGESYCSCPDYRVNTLGTCKHIIHTLDQMNNKFSPEIKEIPYEIQQISLYLIYGEILQIRFLLPQGLPSYVLDILGPLKEEPIHDLDDLIRRIRKVEKCGFSVQIYPDAEEYIQLQLIQKQIQDKAKDIRKNPQNHPLRHSLLKTELLPYQLDGIAFAVAAGRAIIADDMGLGKTIQGIGVAEFLCRELNISKVLIICPASLKSQWQQEIHNFSDRTSQLILGAAAERAKQYENPDFFTICNYEQVLRDISYIETVKWDLIILDEGQRIKNWEAKTSRIVKGLKSPFALVLTGTPLQNRLDDLYSVIQFIDDRRLGPAFRFFNRHRVVNDRGRVLGYKNLDELREKLKPVLLRRTRKEVLDELPPRTTQLLKIPPTAEQLEIHGAQQRIISSIVGKPYLTEMDLLRLQKALLICRMVANSTFLVDKEPPGYSTKLKELEMLIGELINEEDRKIVLFSEWTTMLDLIEPILDKYELTYVRLDGSIPQKKRPQLMRQFKNDPGCKFFLSTNAGSTGLNLQAANTIINVDLPWNPAILEQRIARAHRMGQKRPVQVYLLVTEDTLEENLLGTLSAKQQLYLAVLDPDAETTQVSLSSGIEELKKRLEILLGQDPAKPVDESERRRVEFQTKELEQKERIASAGGELFNAAFSFINEMLPQTEETDEIVQLTQQFKNNLTQCLEKGEDGKLRMSISLPNEAAIDNLSASLAKMMSLGGGKENVQSKN